MPVFPTIISMSQVLMASAMRRLGASMGIRRKRQRRAVPYADELLARAAAKVALQKAQARR